MYKRFNSKYNKSVITISPGEYVTATNGEILRTLLSSCLAVCVFDEIKKIGGMNHFLLSLKTPENGIQLFKNPSFFYYNGFRQAIILMEMMISELYGHGAQRKNLMAKVFGGNRNKPAAFKKNIDFLKTYMRLEKIPMRYEEMGKYESLPLLFYTDTFEIVIKDVEGHVGIKKSHDRNWSWKRKKQISSFNKK